MKQIADCEMNIFRAAAISWIIDLVRVVQKEKNISIQFNSCFILLLLFLEQNFEPFVGSSLLNVGFSLSFIDLNMSIRAKTIISHYKKPWVFTKLK